MHRQCRGTVHLAQHVDLAFVAARHAHHVAGGQHQARQVGALAHQFRHVDGIRDALARHDHLALVGGRQEAAGAADAFEQGHRHVVDRLAAGRLDVAVDVHLLAAVGQHAQGQVGVLDRLDQALGQQAARFQFGHAGHLDRADIGELDHAGAVHHEGRRRLRARARQRLGAGCRNVQFRVVPHQNREEVPRSDDVGTRLAEQGLHALVGVLFLGQALLLDQVGRNQLDDGFRHRRRVRAGHTVHVDAHARFHIGAAGDKDGERGNEADELHRPWEGVRHRVSGNSTELQCEMDAGVFLLVQLLPATFCYARDRKRTATTPTILYCTQRISLNQEVWQPLVSVDRGKYNGKYIYVKATSLPFEARAIYARKSHFRASCTAPMDNRLTSNLVIKKSIMHLN